MGASSSSSRPQIQRRKLAKSRRRRVLSRRRRQRLSDHWHRLLGIDAVWVVLLLGVGSWCLAPRGFFTPELEAGAIATHDYLAASEVLVPDEETTREHRRRAREEVLPVYDYDPAAAGELDEQLVRLFAEGRDFLSYASQAAAAAAPQQAPAEQAEPPEEDLLVALQTASTIKIDEPAMELLRARKFSTELEDRLRGLLVTVLRTGVVDNQSLLLENRLRGVTLRNLQTGEEGPQLDLYDYRDYPKDVQAYLEAEVRRWGGWTAAERSQLIRLLLANIAPNLYFNRSETQARQEAAAAAAQTSFTQIRKGQVIVRKGDVIDEAAVRAWNAIGGRRQSLAQVLPVLGNALLLVLVALATWLGLRTQLRRHGQVEPALGALLLLIVLGLLAAQFGLLLSSALSNSESSPVESQLSYFHAIPFAALALVTSLLYGRATALVVAVMYSVLMARLFEDNALWALIYTLAGSLAAVYSLDRLKQRSAVTRAGLVVGGVNMATSLMLTAFAGEARALPEVGFDLLCGLVGGLLVAAAASFMVPVFESLFAVTTDIKLIELSDTNLPVLRRLAFEAPGTFQHSLMVANLAKVGCEAIGANPVLAYTGGLYHDIGKVFRPDYFVENQRGGENRHDKLSPSMSNLIVISHVKEGVQLAEEHRLPQPIKDAIEQHHGTRVLTFFYKRAVEQAEPDGEEVPESEYRYPGPKPKSKVMGVLMYADAVEAASRTLINPSPVKLRGLLRTILDDCLQDGQLDETDLTLSDLRQVTKAFFRVLETIYHKRVDYPGFDFNTEKRDKPLRVVDASRS